PYRLDGGGADQVAQLRREVDASRLGVALVRRVGHGVPDREPVAGAAEQRERRDALIGILSRAGDEQFVAIGAGGGWADQKRHGREQAQRRGGGADTEGSRKLHGTGNSFSGRSNR